MTRIKLTEGLARLRAGRRWWPAEIVLRAFGSLLLAGFWRLALVEHRMATTPVPHQASAGDLGICAVMVFLLCAGLTLTFAGPVLFLDVPLPPHFTRPTN